MQCRKRRSRVRAFLDRNELTLQLARSVPEADLLVAQEEPERYRKEIGRMLASLPEPLGSRHEPSIDPEAARESMMAEPGLATPRHTGMKPTVSLPSVTQTLNGEGNMAINTGNIAGNFRVQAPPASQRKASRPRQDEEEVPPPPAPSPIRILFLGADPKDSTRLRLDEEVREIDQALTTAALGARFELCQKWAVRTTEIQSYLLRYKPQILHFSGHGSDQNAIFLETEDGMSRPVAALALARLLAQFNRHLRCVVLNACYAAEQAEAIAEHIDCVVGMSAAIDDRAAIRFTASFYQALAFGSSVRDAFDLSRADIEISELGQADVPRLIARRRGADEIVFAQLR